jgi:hypothetical protein
MNFYTWNELFRLIVHYKALIDADFQAVFAKFRIGNPFYLGSTLQMSKSINSKRNKNIAIIIWVSLASSRNPHASNHYSFLY